jgi:hypothetical protein
MEMEIFVPHSALEQQNMEALVAYLNDLYYF